MDIQLNAFKTALHSFLYRERERTANGNERHELLKILWLLLGFVLLAISLTPVVGGDGHARYQDLINMVDGKKPIDKFSSIQMLLSMPLYYLGQLFGQAQLFVGYFNLIIFFATSCALWVLGDKHKRFEVVLLLMAASMIPHHLSQYYGELLTVCTVTVGVFCLIRKKKLVALILLGIGTAQTPATTPALGIVLLYLSVKQRQPAYLLILLIPFGMTAVDYWFKYGSPFSSPYMSMGERAHKTLMPYSGLPGFSYPFFLGLLSILFSFGKGLMFFAPALFLRWKLAERPSQQDKYFLYPIDIALLFTLGLVLTYSRWYGWYGGNFWGPRFFLFASVPACLILAQHFTQTSWQWIKQPLFIAALALSGWVCIQGYIFGNSNLQICGENKSALEFLCWYVPEFSPIFRQFVTSFDMDHPIRLIYAGWCALSLFIIVLNAFKPNKKYI
jgi:hypothetical protein